LVIGFSFVAFRWKPGVLPLPVVIRSSIGCRKFDGDPKGSGPRTANEVTAVMGSSMPLMSLDTSTRTIWTRWYGCFRCPYMDSSSLASRLSSVIWLDCIRISGLSGGIRRCRAIMGYSRTGSQSLCRTVSTRTFSGSSSAGSTDSPLVSLLRNRR